MPVGIVCPNVKMIRTNENSMKESGVYPDSVCNKSVESDAASRTGILCAHGEGARYASGCTSFMGQRGDAYAHSMRMCRDVPKHPGRLESVVAYYLIYNL